MSRKTFGLVVLVSCFCFGTPKQESFIDDEVIERIRKSKLPDKDVVIDILGRASKLLESYDILRYFDMPSDKRVELSYAISEIADMAGNYYCDRLACNIVSECIKFDLRSLYEDQTRLESTAREIVTGISQYQDIPRLYGELAVDRVLEKLVQEEPTDLVTLLSDETVPESLVPYLDADGDNNLNQDEKFIVYYSRFRIGLIPSLIGIEVVRELAFADDPMKIIDIIPSYFVQCRPKPIAKIFDDTFLQKLDQNTLLDTGFIKDILTEAAVLNSFNVYEYHEKSVGYRIREDAAYAHYMELYKDLLCGLLPCKSKENCKLSEHRDVFTSVEQKHILDTVLVPPADVFKKLKREYDAKGIYFIIKELISSRSSDSVEEEIKKAADLNEDGHLHDDEKLIEGMFNDVLKYAFLEHTFKVIKRIVDVETKEELTTITEKDAYCIYDDIHDENFYVQAKGSLLFKNVQHLTDLISNARTLSAGTIVDYFEQSEDWSHTRDISISQYIEDYGDFICENFLCRYDGQCNIKDDFTLLAFTEEQRLKDEIVEWEPEGMSPLAEASDLLIKNIKKTLSEGWSGLLRNFVAERNVPELPARNWDTDHGGDGHVEEELSIDYSKHISGYIFIRKSVDIIVKLVNARSSPVIDEIFASVAQCQCMEGFSGRHCEECSRQKWANRDKFAH